MRRPNAALGLESSDARSPGAKAEERSRRRPRGLALVACTALATPGCRSREAAPPPPPSVVLEEPSLAAGPDGATLLVRARADGDRCAADLGRLAVELRDEALAIEIPPVGGGTSPCALERPVKLDRRWLAEAAQRVSVASGEARAVYVFCRLENGRIGLGQSDAGEIDPDSIVPLSIPGLDARWFPCAAGPAPAPTGLVALLDAVRAVDPDEAVRIAGEAEEAKTPEARAALERRVEAYLASRRPAATRTATGALVSIVSRPAGATVRLDGVVVGTTPYVRSLATTKDTLLLALELADHPPWSGVLRRNDDGHFAAEVLLAPSEHEGGADLDEAAILERLGGE